MVLLHLDWLLNNSFHHSTESQDNSSQDNPHNKASLKDQIYLKSPTNDGTLDIKNNYRNNSIILFKKCIQLKNTLESKWMEFIIRDLKVGMEEDMGISINIEIKIVKKK
jgi:hypothetical protein